MGYFVYLVECRDGSYYCGYTDNLKKRVEAHNKGRGARYTRSRRPVRLVYYEEKEGKQEALRREAQIKSCGRAAKRLLVEGFKAL
jgi:putative endonuclease